MSHELYVDKKTKKVSFAFTGPRDAVWHGLGNQLSEDADIETWKKEAGMDWVVEESGITYLDVASSGIDTIREFPNRKILYRNDNGDPLSIVGKDYHVVQPSEVIEFFRDLSERHNMKLSTAGCLFNGTRFWALAETGKSFEPINGDVSKAYLLFVTSVDGSIANTAKFVSTRVVCNNTMTIALTEKSKSVVRRTHKSIWDPSKVKIDLGLLDSSWNTFMNNLKALANHKMSDDEVNLFFKSTFYDPKKEEDYQPASCVKQVNNLMYLYKSGDGAEYDYGTALGAFNAVTNLFTHGTGRLSMQDRRFWSAYFDDGSKIKTMDSLLEMC